MSTDSFQSATPSPANNTPARLPLSSTDPLASRYEELKTLFPMAVTDGLVDWEKLRAVMGDAAASGPERYGLSWAGKSDALKTLRQQTTATLLPAPSESVNWDTTGNAIIEGDNLEVLKVLQRSYHGKVKLIYIDPPYNTGGDFVYPDDYAEGLNSYLQFTRQANEEGVKLTTNVNTSGRYHSRWLTMMYPRLFLARNLLREDGVIFISIDDHEVHNLRLVMDEIFGEENFIGQVAVVNNLKGRNDSKNVATCHEHTLIYGRTDSATLNGLPLTDEQRAQYKHQDESGEKYALRDLRKRGRPDRREDRPKMFFPIYYNPQTKQCSLKKTSQTEVEILPKRGDGSDGRWRWGKDRVESNQSALHARFSERNSRWDIEHRVYLRDAQSISVEGEDDLDEDEEPKERSSKPKSIWMGGELSTDVGRRAFKTLFPEVDYDYPKAPAFIQRCLLLGLNASDLVLDFFAGSGTTGHAVLELNKEDGGNRKFILVQLPEPTGRKDFPTIADITKERVRRVIGKMETGEADQLSLSDGLKPDRGFKVFKLAPSNFAVWDPSLAPQDADGLGQQWELTADNVRSDASEQALLHELMLKSGLPLSSPIQTVEVNGLTVYLLDEGRLLICLARELTHESIQAMIDLKPQSVLCLDVGFKGSDALKVNAQLEFQSHGIQFRTA